MNLSLEYIERCSAETGFQAASLEKVARLGELAADIARHPFLGGRLALKGGTDVGDTKYNYRRTVSPGVSFTCVIDPCSVRMNGSRSI